MSDQWSMRLSKWPVSQVVAVSISGKTRYGSAFINVYFDTALGAVIKEVLNHLMIFNRKQKNYIG